MFLSKGKKQTWNSKHTSIIFSEGLDVFQVFFVFWFCVGNRWPVTFFFFGRKRVGHVFFLKKTDACLEVGEDWYLWRHHGWRLEGNRAMTWLMYTGKTPGNNDSMLTLGIGPIFEVNEDASTTTSEFWWLTFLVFCFRIFSRTYPTNHWDELRRCISTLRLLRPMVVDLRLHLEIRKSSSNVGLARRDRVWRTWGLYLPAFFAASIVCSQLATLTSGFFARCRSVKWGESPEKSSCPLICFLGQVCPMMSWASFANLRCLDISEGLLGRSWWLCCFTILDPISFP